MKLVTIPDLQRPDEELAPLIAQAQRLGDLWMEFVKQDQDYHEYTVIDHGEKNRSAGIHASEMSKCMRKMVYSILGTKREVAAQTVDPNMKLRFRTGTAIHSQLQSDWKRMAQWYTARFHPTGYALHFEAELGIKKELQDAAEAWGLSSSCDGAFTFLRYEAPSWVPYLRVGAEIKTSSDPAYQKRKKPEPDHLEQTCLYQACLDLPLMWVIYYNKSNSNFTTPYAPWLYKFDQSLWTRELEMRFAKAHHHAESGQLPDRTEGGHCGWCPFTHACQPTVLSRTPTTYYHLPVATSSGMRT